MKDFINNFDWEDDVSPLKAIILSIVTLFGGFGLMKLSLLAGWWFIIPTWFICIVLIIIVIVATGDKLFGD